jgi:hypothetical protein
MEYYQVVLSNNVTVDSYFNNTLDNIKVKLTIKSDKLGCMVDFPSMNSMLYHYELRDKNKGMQLFERVSLLNFYNLKVELRKLSQ